MTEGLSSFARVYLFARDSIYGLRFSVRGHKNTLILSRDVAQLYDTVNRAISDLFNNHYGCLCEGSESNETMDGEHVTKIRFVSTCTLGAILFAIIFLLVDIIGQVTYDCYPQKCVDVCHALGEDDYLLFGWDRGNGCQETIQNVFGGENYTGNIWIDHTHGYGFACLVTETHRLDVCAQASTLFTSIYPDACGISLWHTNWTHVESLMELVKCFSRQRMLPKIIFILWDASVGLSQEAQDKYMTWFDEHCSLYKEVN